MKRFLFSLKIEIRRGGKIDSKKRFTANKWRERGEAASREHTLMEPRLPKLLGWAYIGLGSSHRGRHFFASQVPVLESSAADVERSSLGSAERETLNLFRRGLKK